MDEAETLLDVIRYRAAHDAQRTHLLITEDDGRRGTAIHTDVWGVVRGGAEVRGGIGAARRARRRTRVADAADFAAVFFRYTGILLAGAVPVPIYPPFRADRIEEYAERQSAILNNAGVCLLLTFRRAEAVAKLAEAAREIASRRGGSGKIAGSCGKSAAARARRVARVHQREPHSQEQRHCAAAIHVGIDGRSEGRGADAREPAGEHAGDCAKRCELGPGDVGISWLPLYHDMGLIGAWLTLLHYGVPLVVMSPLAFLTRPERWLRAIRKHQGTITAAPNFAYELCVRKISDKEMEGVDLSSMRVVMNGAEPVNPETLERFAKRFAKYGFRRESMLPVYGLAEASLGVTVPPLNRVPRVERVEREAFATQGRRCPREKTTKTRLRLCRRENVPRGMTCRLWMNKETRWQSGRRDSVVPRAVGDERILPERGGDADFVSAGTGAARGRVCVAEFRRPGVSSGRRDFITGRVKDIIIKGGRNLYPHEVEELAARAEGIRKGCVVAFGLKDESSGTEKLVIVAEVARENAAEAGIAAAITEEVSRGLGLPPDRVELIPSGSIPKTSSGKLRRDETKQLYCAGSLPRRRLRRGCRLRGWGRGAHCAV